MSELKYKRLLVKLSGEALMGQYDFGIDPDVIKGLAVELDNLQQAGVEMGVVIGGGNIFRGAGLAQAGLDRVAGDHMGMLATVMNAIALKDGLQKQGLKVSVMSGLSLPQVCENYTQRDAREKIGQGEIVIFAAGTGNPYFTTDTGASLRAIEIQADLMIKATNVDGIYDSDPMKNTEAKKFDHITYDQAIDQRLAVMDITAMVLCNENDLDMSVCNISEKNALLALARGENLGTRVTK
ncbi:MAG: UMP kinase [Gammaproteobacteria bacterium]|jgi:uridylate kinase|nr:UMP kinase [Gammaproteobacteria bacterium]MBT3723828.1 UMP kinase [Gammaproteobacteria bacterium]MBT4078918.1 UMP kinase [Gammaproteobacteria bacterium]MBT4196378.1 UMP kinase [Gammaproteobacteria bacterium]MBT4448201.1 UMP kinase [Gammaproteobacteria bacterium]